MISRSPGRKTQPRRNDLAVVIPKRAERAFRRWLKEWQAARLRPKGWWRAAFLKHLAGCGNITQAADASQILPREVYRLAERDPTFKQEVKEAKQVFSDRVEYAAITRAIDGIPLKKFYKDQPLIDPETGEQYVERQYSDALLIKLLESKKRAEYGRQVKHDHQTTQELRVAGMTPEEARQQVLDRIKRLITER